MESNTRAKNGLPDGFPTLFMRATGPQAQLQDQQTP
jgi:hypothetical protein